MNSDTMSRSVRSKDSRKVVENMQQLLSDLYYKKIVEAHADVIEKGTRNQIAEIMWEFKNHHISKHEMFTKIESLRSGYKETDNIIKDALVEARAKFTKAKRK